MNAAPIARSDMPWLRNKARVVPIASTMLGSVLPLLVPIVATAPVLPPFGLLTLLAWRLLRPGFWAIWAPLPLGLFDDLASGQPIGSAMLCWTLAFLAIDFSERSMLWRDYLQDWLVAAAAIAGCLIAGSAFAMLAGGAAPLQSIAAQVMVSILAFPAVARLCARLDAWRLR